MCLVKGADNSYPVRIIRAVRHRRMGTTYVAAHGWTDRCSMTEEYRFNYANSS